MAKTKDNSKELSGLQEQLRVIRFKAQGSKSKNVKEAAALKKQIARILTEINSPQAKAAK